MFVLAPQIFLAESMLQMSNILGDVSEEAFMLWSFGCLNDSQHRGPIEELILPRTARILCWRSGRSAKASPKVCFDGIVRIVKHGLVVKGGKSRRNKALGDRVCAPPATNGKACEGNPLK